MYEVVEFVKVKLILFDCVDVLVDDEMLKDFVVLVIFKIGVNSLIFKLMFVGDFELCL